MSIVKECSKFSSHQVILYTLNLVWQEINGWEYSGVLFLINIYSGIGYYKVSV